MYRHGKNLFGYISEQAERYGPDVPVGIRSVRTRVVGCNGDITTVGWPRGFAGCYGDSFRTSSKKASTSNGKLCDKPSPIQFIGILAVNLNTASCNCPLCFQVAAGLGQHLQKRQHLATVDNGANVGSGAAHRSIKLLSSRPLLRGAATRCLGTCPTPISSLPRQRWQQARPDLRKTKTNLGHLPSFSFDEFLCTDCMSNLN